MVVGVKHHPMDPLGGPLDPHSIVRKAALVAQIVEKGDEHASTVRSGHLEATDWRVREAAVKAPAQIGEKGDVAALAPSGRELWSQLWLRPCQRTALRGGAVWGPQ